MYSYDSEYGWVEIEDFFENKDGSEWDWQDALKKKGFSPNVQNYTSDEKAVDFFELQIYVSSKENNKYKFVVDINLGNSVEIIMVTNTPSFIELMKNITPIQDSFRYKE